MRRLNCGSETAAARLGGRVGGERTKKETVTVALEEYIARRAQARIVDHFGSFEWDDGYDYKADRASHDRKLGDEG